MSLIKKPIKISVAAELLGVSMSSIRQRKAGTDKLTLFKRPGCRLLFTYDTEVKRLLEQHQPIGGRGK